MPEQFIDHVTPEPRRFDIQADGNDGTDLIAEVNGKTVKFLENFGVPSQVGTNLNAEELNKRIIGDFEDKTFTELRTLLDTLNIDKDQNANMVVNKILMRTLYNSLIGGLGDDLSTWTINAQISTDGTYFIIDTSSSLTFDKNINLPAGNYLIITKAFRDNNDGSTIGLQFLASAVLQDEFALGTELDTVEKTISEIITLPLAVDQIKWERGPVGTNVNVKEIMIILITNTYLNGLTAAQISAQIEYFEGKAKTINPHLLTIGKNKFDKLQGTPFFRLVGNGTTSASGSTSHSDYIRINETYDYHLSGNNGAARFIDYYDINKVFISSESWLTTKQLTIPSNTSYMRFSYPEVNIDIAQLELGTVASDYADYNSNEDNKFGFQAKGNSVTNNVETVEDSIELINNKYVHIQRILEDEANFQAIGGVSGNWAYDALNLHFEMDFATLGIDPNFVSGIQSLARIIIDGVVYTNDISVGDLKFIFNDGTGLISGNPGILFIDLSFVSTVALAAYIAAATEVIFDFYMKPADWVETEIISTGYTVIEENGTVIEENDESIAFETEAEIPVNIPAAILENTKEIRRLHNIKNEYVILEDFSDDNLDIPSTGTPGIFTTDRMSEEFDSYILLYKLPSVLLNENPGVIRIDFVNPYHRKPIATAANVDIRKKLARMRASAVGGDDLEDYQFILYFLQATPNQLGIGSGAARIDRKIVAGANTYFGKVSTVPGFNIEIVALLGVKSNE